MREIKFRAYTDGKMFHDVGVVRNIVVLECEYSEEYGDVDLEPTYYGLNDDSIKLMQFTGLHDTNKKEVYEGDILKFTDVDFAYVSFYEGKYLTNAIYEGRFTARSDFENLDLDYALRIGKVIGNIYENPELLKEDVK